jgi:hypothetical protein
MNVVLEERKRCGSRLSVIWKYILFEWNDSDEEIRHAAFLAQKMEVILEFVLTHSPGRSRRFETMADLQHVLQVLAPAARTDQTFRRRQPAVSVNASELEEEIRSLLPTAKWQVQSQSERTAIGLIVRALDYDCGVRPETNINGDRSLIRDYLPLVLAHGRFPATLAGLAEIFHEWKETDVSIHLLKRYVRLTKLPWKERFWLVLRLKLQMRTRLRAALVRLNGGRVPKPPLAIHRQN